MNCPYCAEEIQSAAIVCRFCGASRNAQGEWSRAPIPPTPPAQRKGQTTFRWAGAFFVISGAVSIASVTSSVPLLGAMRGGVIALLYNFFYILLFVGVGAGLFLGRPWSYRLFWAGTAIYSLDSLGFLLGKSTRAAYLAASGVTREVGSLIDVGMLDQGVFLGSIVSLLSWWGFALYVYIRRDYFRSSHGVLDC